MATRAIVRTLFAAALVVPGASQADPIGPYPAYAGETQGRVIYENASEQHVITDLEEWGATATSISLHDQAKLSFMTQEVTLGDHTFSVVKVLDQTLLYKRAATDLAPSIQIGNNELVLTPSAGQCGFCITAWQRAADFEEMNCSIWCDGCVCTWCESHPCPDPEPPGDPCEDWDDTFDTWSECLDYYGLDEGDMVGPIGFDVMPR